MRLRIAEDLSLPIEAVTEKSAFLGRTGSGKTYAAQKLAEEMHRAGAQFIALDPVGKWWSLRLAADGKTPALPIPVFGGLHGDIPLESGAGKLMADLVVDRGISAVIDVSQFESDTQKARFMTDFGNRFFFRKKAAPSAVHLFIEEAQEFVPQNPQRDEAIMLHAWTRIQKLGRNFGIGSSLLTQRPQEVNKKVLNLTEVLFVFQLTGTHERESVAKWIEDKGLDEDIAAELPKLAVGRPHVWSPAWLQISKVVSIGQKHTYDASKTPTVGHRQDVKELTPIDLAKLQKDMAATIERAKQEDPRELRREIADLRRQLSVKTGQSSVKAEKQVTVVEIPVIRPRELKALQKSAAYLETIWSRFEAAGQTLRQNTEHVRELANQRLKELRIPREAVQTGHRVSPTAVTEDHRVRPAGPKASQDGAGAIRDKCQRAVMTVLAQQEQPCQIGRLALLAGYRVSGGFRNALSGLRSAGYLDGPNTGCMVATATGLAALGPVESLPTPGDGLVQYWLNHPSIKKCERATLSILVDCQPAGLDIKTLASKAGYEVSGGFRNSLSVLRTAGLIVGGNTGEMRASDALF